MKKKSTYYMVGNAHLDPVWQWRWQEGSAEAKATIRSALDRMKEFPDFIFVCSSASVFQWVEEFAPKMFEEVKQRVAEGRFIIVGGMHVQPDCNNPSGEGFARQTLYSQRYFQEKFGTTAKVGYNVDSFGHNLMLPQILKKSGMDSYIFMRPGEFEKHLDSDLFDWVSPDGSSVTTCRIVQDGYSWNFHDMDEFISKMAEVDAKAATDLDEALLFYGVGNHGGGPTIKNLTLIEEHKKQRPETNLIYSTISDFFDLVRERNIPLPKHQDDLQHHASGCYAAMSAIKVGIRRGETGLIAAEAFSTLAHKLCNKPVRTKEFEKAWRKICFLHFHDAMGGVCTSQVYEDAAYQYGAAQDIAAEQENNALQTISWDININGRDKGLPVVVFNHNGFDVDELVRVNRYGEGVVDSQGNEIPYQNIFSYASECMHRTDVLFKAHVPAMGYAVYYIKDTWPSLERRLQISPDVPDSPAKAIPYTGYRTANNHEGTVLENDLVRIEFELHTGYISSLKDKRTGKEWITGNAAVPMVADEYYHNAWGHGGYRFKNFAARFMDAEVTVVESGPVRATVKVVSHYNTSKLTQYFSLEAGSDKLSVQAEVDWREKHKQLQIAWPMQVSNPKAYYEIPFGVIERPADGEEEPGLQWTAIKGENGGFALLNNDTYSSSVDGNTIYQTVVRSPIYGDGGGARTSESEFTDQGIRKFRYTLMPVGDSWAPVIQTARQLNKPVASYIETWHPGSLTGDPYGAIQISADNVMLSACKRSEDGTGLILRLYETDGKETPVTVSGDLLATPLEVTFSPWSMRTYYLADGAAEWKEVLITEYDMNTI